MFPLVPMLQTQRSIYDLPRGLERFRRYLEVMTDGTDEMLLPLPVFNPMGKAQAAEALDAWIALDAEAVAVEALEEARTRLEGIEAPESVRFGLVLADDAGGGWTDRLLMEAHGLRQFPSRLWNRGWLIALLWTSDRPTRDIVRRDVLATIYRTFALLRFGPPRTLAEVLEQEGWTAVFAGSITPSLEPEDLEYSRLVLQPYLDSDDFPIWFACLYGDAAARSKGYRPLGLSPHAGLALARSEILRRDLAPEEVLRKADVTSKG